MILSAARAADLAGERFLRVPPFPGARVQRFREVAGARVDSKQLAARLRCLRVGGRWQQRRRLPAAQPEVHAPGGTHEVGRPLMGGRCWI